MAGHPFQRVSVRYGETPEPVTPYQKAGQVWDERLGSARVQASNWRLAALGVTAVSVVLGLTLLAVIGRSGIVPYVVEVDRLGEVRAVGPALEAYQPSDAQIAHFLARFIENVRSLSIDPVIVRSNWLRAYDFVTDRGAQVLNDYARETDPFAKIGSRTVTAEVTSVVRASHDSFEIRWKENSFENGSIAKTERFTGLVTTVLKPPVDAETLRKNPLGLYVHSLNWSRDLIGDAK
ncbi:MULTISPECIES: conjugal transfer protein TrbF [Bradyrhizobium]|jgi:type IV secretion system protein TrbF|uniref:conjugal transfer protein TrbF n=1 Tax=Bradyrhizobium TaxID=374 RepID=UPI0004814BEA|nr:MULTISPECIES: conjugal transfer protein TrbF [Bradyrhizobium]MDI2059086.1 conjugal transfer protein TrbF [Bradyrhizobium sp. Mp19]MDI2103760.1 conjugal transfer protein TrbF [Bradyrhizobium sp. Mp64]WLB03555.1 conjugal transfer protein TrbF [Bradyrhizobium elkanii]WLC04830.1 conjugal transfer protein TrbF [Bradyrhizobium elkanii USDA 94]